MVPTAITGTFQALAARRGYIPRRVPLRVRFGPPLRFARYSRRPLTQRLRADITGCIMEEIATLLVDNRPLAAPTGVPR